MPTRITLIILLILALAVTGTTLSAQVPQVMTIAVPAFWEILFDDQVLADFEAEHNVDVQLVYAAALPAPTGDTLDQDAADQFVDALVDYAQAADVLYVDNGILTPETTRSEVFLDLSPLVSSDPNINPDDFYPAIWDSFRWDTGLWGLPIAGETTLVEYIPAAFDEKQVSYPDAHWTLEQYAEAARQLAEYDQDGNVTLPGMLIGSDARALLFYALMGRGFSDDQPVSMPQFPADDLVPLLETWAGLQDEGVIVTDGGAYLNRITEIPLRLGGGGFMAVTISADNGDSSGDAGGSEALNFLGELPQTALAPLPNITGGISAQGFAISSGTSNPELAYELVRYLSERPEVVQTSLGGEAARRSYFASSIEDDGPQITLFTGGGERSEADKALVDQVLENGLTGADLRFSQYLNLVFDLMGQGMDASTALSQVELEAVQFVSMFSGRDITVFVDTPAPVVVPEGQIELSFGLTSFIQPLPNRDEWERLANEFAMNDPEVGLVTIDSGFMTSGDMLGDHDCIYQPAPSGLLQTALDQLLELDPLLNADTTYDTNDLPAGILAQVQVNNQTYGLPITLRPEVLTYNADTFAGMGLSQPPVDWDFSTFVDTLRQLDEVLDAGTYPLEAVSPNNTHLLMLIAAQGGLLFDTSVEPVAIDFTSPESLNAIRSVLDLAKDGLMDYTALGQTAGMNFVAAVSDVSPNIRASNFFGGVNNTNQLIPYPRGQRYVPVAFDVGAGYISTESSHPEACYRWLSTIAHNPYVFMDMPALTSMLNDAHMADSAGQAALDAYRGIAERVSSPNAVSPIIQDPYLANWLNGAFDAYVQDDADLETALADAEQLTQAYIACTSESGTAADSITQDNRQSCYDMVNSGS